MGTNLPLCFQQDKGFDRHLFERQMGVMHGQISNLRVALNDSKSSPVKLVQMQAVHVKRWVDNFYSGFATALQTQLTTFSTSCIPPFVVKQCEAQIQSSQTKLTLCSLSLIPLTSLAVKPKLFSPILRGCVSLR